MAAIEDAPREVKITSAVSFFATLIELLPLLPGALHHAQRLAGRGAMLGNRWPVRLHCCRLPSRCSAVLVLLVSQPVYGAFCGMPAGKRLELGAGPVQWPLYSSLVTSSLGIHARTASSGLTIWQIRKSPTMLISAIACWSVAPP